MMLSGPQDIPYTAPVSPLLEGDAAPDSAVAGNGADATIAAHYGNPSREQRALDAGRAVVDLSNRGVVTLTGADRLTILHVLSSQQLEALAPGTSTETLFLDIRGRIEFHVKVFDDGQTTWLSTEPGLNASLAAWLQAMKFAYRVEITDRTDELAVIGSTEAVPGWESYPCWVDAWPQISEGGYPYTEASDPSAHPGADWRWREYVIARETLPRVPQQLPDQWMLAGSFAAESLRIAAGRPRQGADMDEKSIPHELDLLRTAVHLTKGCYKGQETVARVHNLGHPPRRVVLLMIDGSMHGLPPVGSDIVLRPAPGEDLTPKTDPATARPVGTLTSVAHHYEMGAVGLAVIKRTVAQDAELLIREDLPHDPNAVPDAPTHSFTAASQELLVSTTAGNTVGRPAGLSNLRRGQ